MYERQPNQPIPGPFGAMLERNPDTWTDAEVHACLHDLGNYVIPLNALLGMLRVEMLVRLPRDKQAEQDAFWRRNGVHVPDEAIAQRIAERAIERGQAA